MVEENTLEERSWMWWVSAFCIGGALAALVCFIVYRVNAILVPFIAGFVVAYIFDPLLDKLEDRGWSRRRAVWTVMGALLSVMALALVLLVPRVVTEASDAWQNRELYGERAAEFYNSTKGRAEDVLGNYMPDSDVTDYIDAQVQAAITWADENKATFLTWLGSATLQALGMVVLLALGTLVAFHFMIIIDPLRDSVKGLFLSESQGQEVDETVERVNRMLGAYVRGMAGVSIAVAIVTTLGLWGASLGFGTRYSLILGLLAGVTYAVPWVGQIVSAGAAGFFALVTADHHAAIAAIVAVIVVVAVNQIFDNVVMPRIVGESVGLHPLVVLFAIMAGYTLWGLVGMIVAVPVAAIIRIGLRRWIPILPDDEKKTTGLPRLDTARMTQAVGDAMRRITGSRRVHPAASTRAPSTDTDNQPPS